MAVTGDPGPAGRRGLRLAVVDWAPTFYRWRFYRYLKERAGWEPSVLFCGRRHSTFGWEYLPDDALPHRFLPGGRWQFDRAGLRSFYWNRGGPAALAAWRPDAVLLNGWFGWPFLAAARWCRRHRVPYLVWADMQERAPAPWYRTAVKRVSLRPFLRRAGAVAGWTPAARDYLVRWGGDPARAGVIPAAPPVEWMRERTRAWPAPERAKTPSARASP